MKNIITAIILINLFIFSACNKQPEHFKNTVNQNILRGKVIEAITNNPVEGALVTMTISSGGLLGGKIDSIKTVTDKEGNYILPYNAARSSYNFDLSYSKTGYLTYGKHTSQIKVKDTAINVAIEREAFIKFHLINVSKTSDNNFLRLRIDNIHWALYNLKIENDTFITAQVPGNKLSQIYWEYYVNNKPMNTTDSVYAPVFQSVDYEIRF